MTYNAVRVIEFGEAAGLRYPSLDENLLIVPEPADGPLDAPINASSVSVRRKVGNGWVNQVRATDISIQLWATGSRLLVYSRKYTKSGGWVGFNLSGLAVAAAANAISAGVAAGQRRGKALVGGIRYPWIAAVSFAPRNGRNTRETLEIEYVDGTDATKPTCSVTFHLENHVEANRIARYVADKVIAYRYASPLPIAENALERYEKLRTSGLMGPPPKGYLHSYRIPTSFSVPGGVDELPAAPPAFPAQRRVFAAFAASSEAVLSEAPDVVDLTSAPSGVACAECGSQFVGSAFCTDCGAPRAAV